MLNIAIIGGGFAGLVIAKLLGEKAKITIFEKSRGVGGRMATRYADEWEFDHGAPFFDVKTNEFAKFLEPLVESGIVVKWNPRFASSNFYSHIAEPHFDARNLFVGSPRMNSIGKHLANGLDIFFETKIVKMEKILTKWILTCDKMIEYRDFDFVITTVPPLQAFDILPPNCLYLQNLSNVKMLPVFCAMLGFQFDFTGSTDWDVACFDSSVIDLVVKNHNKPFRKAKPSFVVLANNDWSLNNVDLDKNEVGRLIVLELERLFNCKIETSILQVHRWLYGRIDNPISLDGFLVDNNLGLISCGNWCVSDGVEGAFLSALNVCLFMNNFITQS